MAAPTPVARSAPAGIMLKDGFSTKLTCTADPDMSIKEIEVTPPPDDGGEPIVQTTMFNTSYETKAPQALIDNGEIQITAAYDPVARTQLRAVLNLETTWTVTYPDGSTEAFYGWLRSVTPAALAKGTRPQMSIVIVVSNWDNAAKVEAGPALASVAGT